MAVPVQMVPAEEAERPLENGNAEAIYLETDGEPYVMESLCMSCYENVRMPSGRFLPSKQSNTDCRIRQVKLLVAQTFQPGRSE